MPIPRLLYILLVHVVIAGCTTQKESVARPAGDIGTCNYYPITGQTCAYMTEEQCSQKQNSRWGAAGSTCLP
jgi:hypothetical protein